jgi:ribosome maturation factor RimP
MSHNPLIDRLLSIIEPVCQDAGCEVVDVRLLMDQGGWVLRVCIDRPLPDGADLTQVQEERVDLSECERVSRMLSAVLDVDDPIPQAYSLEVSSPGIDRPLRTAAHFTRYVGAEAKIQLAVALVTPSGERRNFRGALRGIAGSGASECVLIDVDGTVFELPLGDIELARLVPDWDAVMRGESGVAVPKAGERNSPKGKAKRKPGRERGEQHTRGSHGASQGSGADREHEGPDADTSHDEAPRASLTNSPDVPVPGNR